MEGAKRLDNLYSVMQSVEGKLGGGEGVQGIYGSITQTGMQRIYDCMKHSCGLDQASTLVDIGAGLCRPLLHAMVSHGIQGAFGVELDHVKVAKAEAFVAQTLQHLENRGVVEPGLPRPTLLCKSVEEVPSLDPATHAYSFWEGVPHEGKEAFGKLFAASKTLKAVAVVQRAVRGEDPCQMMRSYGFGPLMLISNFTVKMSGSGRSFQAYVFSKVAPASAAFFEAAKSPVSRALPLVAARLPISPSRLADEPPQDPSDLATLASKKRSRAAAEVGQQEQLLSPALKQQKITSITRARKLAVDSGIKPGGKPSAADYTVTVQQHVKGSMHVDKPLVGNLQLSPQQQQQVSMLLGCMGQTSGCGLLDDLPGALTALKEAAVPVRRSSRRVVARQR